MAAFLDSTAALQVVDVAAGRLPTARAETEAGGAEEAKEPTPCVRGIACLLLGACLRYAPTSGSRLPRTTLLSIISRRIGLDAFTEASEALFASPHVVDAQRRRRHQLPLASAAERERVPPFAVTKDSVSFLRALHDMAQRAIVVMYTQPALAHGSGNGQQDGARGGGGGGGEGQDGHPGDGSAPPGGSADGGVAGGNAVVEQYKQLIRSQDKQVRELQQQVADLKARLAAAEEEKEQAGA